MSGTVLGPGEAMVIKKQTQFLMVEWRRTFRTAEIRKAKGQGQENISWSMAGTPGTKREQGGQLQAGGRLQTPGGELELHAGKMHVSTEV